MKGKVGFTGGHFTDEKGEKTGRDELPVDKIVSNNEVAVCDHSRGFYFDEKGIITCVRCHPPQFAADGYK